MAVLLLVLGAVAVGRVPDQHGCGAGGSCGPTAVPILVGLLLLVCAVALAVDVLRGGRGEAEGGEDVDLSCTGAIMHAAAVGRRVLGQRRADGTVGWWSSGCGVVLGLRVRAGLLPLRPRRGDRVRAVVRELCLRRGSGNLPARRCVAGDSVDEHLQLRSMGSRRADPDQPAACRDRTLAPRWVSCRVSARR